MSEANSIAYRLEILRAELRGSAAAIELDSATTRGEYEAYGDATYQDLKALREHNLPSRDFDREPCLERGIPDEVWSKYFRNGQPAPILVSTPAKRSFLSRLFRS